MHKILKLKLNILFIVILKIVGNFRIIINKLNQKVYMEFQYTTKNEPVREYKPNQENKAS